MKRLAIIVYLFIPLIITAQVLQINKVEPPNWWVGHSYNKIQLMVYGQKLDSVKVDFDSENIKKINVVHTKNSNYAFVNLIIDSIAKPGKYNIKFHNKFGEQIIEYSLLKRESTENRHSGFSTDDVVYLLFPDRFANGDPSNDFLSNEKEEYEFGSLNGRHGGDIQGIINKLDYLHDLGITTIWNTPLIENNMYMSYHGYAATDFYNIDPRHGTNELYKELVNKAHDKSIKIIMDHVANHIGINHPWTNNLPTETWLNGLPDNHLPAEHNKVAYVDIHAADNSIKNANQGWFVNYMPDLNQTDTILAKYIIQNTIWWIEYSGIDGIREDTYPYANQKFMAEWAKEILTHYPNFNIVGEVWKGDPAILAKFQTNSYFPKEFDSNLPVVTDFAIRDIIIDYLFGKSDLHAIYEILGKDFVYSNSDNLLVFFDNHDTDRGMYAANWNLHKFKVALTLVLTTRGIPQLFYGTEIGLDGGGHHGKIRGPFPGGFNYDVPNTFSSEGRNKDQNEIFNFTKKLLQLRKNYEVLRKGKLIQFRPKDNVYVYIRSNKNRKIIFFINDNDQPKRIDLKNYIKNQNLTDLLNNREIIISNSSLRLQGKSTNLYLIN